jgi:hypothetical protein
MLTSLAYTQTELEKELRSFYQQYGKDGVVTYAEARKWVSQKDHTKRLTLLTLMIGGYFDKAFSNIKFEFDLMVREIISKESQTFKTEVDEDKIATQEWGNDEANWSTRLENDVALWAAYVLTDIKRSLLKRENINNVLPTIISRCLNLRLSKASKRELVVEAIKKGIVLEDALVLASFNGSMSLIEDCYNNSKYISLKDLVIEMFNEYVEGENILYFSQVEMGDVTLDKVNFRLFLDILDLFLLDVVNYDSEDVNFVEHKDLLKNVHDKMPNISDKVEKIMRYKSQIDLNANLKLLLDSVIINLKGE